MTEPLRRISGMERTILLVGGPRDGEWVDDDGMPVFTVRLANKGSAGIFHPVITTERYSRVEIEGVPVYRHDGLTFNGMTLRLLAHYKPPKGGKP